MDKPPSIAAFFGKAEKLSQERFTEILQKARALGQTWLKGKSMASMEQMEQERLKIYKQIQQAGGQDGYLDEQSLLSLAEQHDKLQAAVSVSKMMKQDCTWALQRAKVQPHPKLVN